MHMDPGVKLSPSTVIISPDLNTVVATPAEFSTCRSTADAYETLVWMVSLVWPSCVAQHSVRPSQFMQERADTDWEQG